MAEQPQQEEPVNPDPTTKGKEDAAYAKRHDQDNIVFAKRANRIITKKVTFFQTVVDEYCEPSMQAALRVTQGGEISIAATCLTY